MSTPETPAIRSHRVRVPVAEMLLGCALFLTACTSIFLTQIPGGVSLFWPGSVLAAAPLIRRARVRWTSASIAVLLAVYFADLLAGHRPWAIALGFACINFLEVSMMVAVFRFGFRIPYPNLTIAQSALMTLVLGIAIPGVAATAGGLFLHIEFAVPWLPGTLQWWSSHTIGACLVGPPLILFSSGKLRQLTRAPYLVENVLTLAVCLVGCFLSIRFIRFPFVTMGLLLLVAAFRLGGFGSSLLSLSVGLLITNMWILGIRPIGLDPATSTSFTLLDLPVLALLATVMPSIAVGLGSDARRAANLARRQAEERLSAERERLRITLGSLNDAVITTDASTRITYINEAAQRLFGFAADEVANRRVDEVIHLMDPQTSIAAANLIGLCALHGAVFRRETPCVLHRPDGSVCHVMDVASPVLDATGAVSALVIVFRDATQDVDRSLELQELATHDSLTGLLNRGEFGIRLSAAFTKTKHLGRPAALIAIDLDWFKAVNDTGGHAAGDAILRKVAAACRDAVRSSDAVARLGGDEFAVLLDNCPADRANSIAQKLLRSLNPLTIQWGGADYAVGASMGLAMSDVGMCNEGAWLEAADQACYAAKKAGRGRLQVSSAVPDA